MNYAELSKTEAQHLLVHHLDDLRHDDIRELLKYHWQELTSPELGKALKIWLNYVSLTDTDIGLGFQEFMESAQVEAVSN